MKTSTNLNNEPTLNDFYKYSQVVFVDQSGYLNLCSNVSEATYLRVKEEAALALQLLDNQLIECFDSLFMKKFSLTKAFDAVIT